MPTSLTLKAALLGVLATVHIGPTSAAEIHKPVVELFTSQGCSSCPPADAVLAELAAKGDVIAVSLPVDYWDYLGWKDTFAQKAFTERQRTYGIARGDREVYTPQAVINGQIHTNGASRSAIAQAVAATAASPAVAVSATKSATGYDISVGALPGSSAKGAVVLALPILAHREVAIGRGENARRKVTYTNIAREIIPLGEASSAGSTLKLPAATLDGADSLIVIVQARAANANAGAILGAIQIAVK